MEWIIPVVTIRQYLLQRNFGHHKLKAAPEILDSAVRLIDTAMSALAYVVYR